MKQSEPLLIAGATGMVGHQLVRLLRQAHPDLPLLLASRTLAKAEQLALEVGHAQAVRMDVAQDRPLAGIRPRAVVALVNDPGDRLLRDALQAGSAYLDITRWTALLPSALELVRVAAPRPVLLASGWMAGLVSTLALLATQSLSQVERIDLSVLYGLNDRSGPDSVEYMARLTTPFEVREDGQSLRCKPYSDPRSVRFPGGRQARAYRFDSPDTLILPAATGARSVSARIAFDDRLSMPLLIALSRSGLWDLFSAPRFRRLRHAILHNPGTGAAHEFVLQLQGLDRHGKPLSQSIEVQDPLGQTHLTAVGALLQVERLLGLDGAAPPVAGEHYPSSARTLPSLLQRLREQGVVVSHR
ncbi:MAG: hypothetical protein ABWY06_18295 [Pseudomonas sp.]|uniref:hypothetical protein n=1 Tax=Pseudomonas sp. TaxID=306 RepID=UPI00339338E4